ncbi:MAG: hypothetical protein IPJ61_18715 [Tessaracoccus sp.]|uniref:hypothetical protein n=1 Tax=Tessaracoccus sp. TaxID=1971211 RepID=UPI001EB15EE9|nr:hypothetical protein [Tessaracoccus sp.]MBK7823018.1 hypothetical protein [Tessaracoccus sp.]
MPAPGQTATTPPKPDSGVAELQRVLKAYVAATGYAAADPGTVDGLVGIKTATAVAMMIPRIPDLPQSVRAMGPVILMLLATDDGRASVYKMIRENASTIAGGIIAMEAYRAGTAASGGGSTPAQGTPAPRTRFSEALTTVLVSAAGSPAVPAMPTTTIWWYAGNQYRVAVPRSATLGGYTDYVEVAPSLTRPNFGTQVSRTDFFKAIGHWWATPIGIGGLVAGGLVVVGGAVLGVRALTR